MGNVAKLFHRGLQPLNLPQYLGGVGAVDRAQQVAGVAVQFARHAFKFVCRTVQIVANAFHPWVGGQVLRPH